MGELPLFSGKSWKHCSTYFSEFIQSENRNISAQQYFQSYLSHFNIHSITTLNQYVPGQEKLTGISQLAREYV